MKNMDNVLVLHIYNLAVLIPGNFCSLTFMDFLIQAEIALCIILLYKHH